MKKLFMDFDAFRRRIERQEKDKNWESDIRSYTFWKEHSRKYPNSIVAKERVQQLEEKYPQLKKEIGEF